MKKVKFIYILITLIFIFSTKYNVLFSQEVTNIGQQVYISPGTDLLIEGDWINMENDTSIPDIVNDGSLILSGNWNNSANTNYAGNGTFELNGNGIQNIAGMNFYNLLVSGNGLKLLTNDANITNKLSVENGRLNTSFYHSIITLAPDATISETPTNYVSGYIKTTRNLSKNILYDFGGLGFELQANLQEPGLTTLIRATGDSAIQGSSGAQSIKRYFDIKPTNSGNLGAAITFRYWDDELNGLSESKLALFNSADNGKSWQNKGYNIRDINNKYLGLPSDINSSRWTLADSVNSVILSVDEVKNSQDFNLRIFPNPTINYLIIEDNKNRNLTFNFMNSNGQIINQGSFINITKLNLSGVSAGIYFLQLKDESGNLFNKKIIVIAE